MAKRFHNSDEANFAGFPRGAYYKPYPILEGAGQEGDYCDTQPQTDEIYNESVARIKKREFWPRGNY